MATPDELRAAADRFLAFDGTGNVMAEAFLLANAYVAEHPADDDEPITVEWLCVMGWELTDTRLELGPLSWHGFDNTMRIDCDILTSLPHITTRGDVRRLCKVLGIELKEGDA